MVNWYSTCFDVAESLISLVALTTHPVVAAGCLVHSLST